MNDEDGVIQVALRLDYLEKFPQLRDNTTNLQYVLIVTQAARCFRVGVVRRLGQDRVSIDAVSRYLAERVEPAA